MTQALWDRMDSIEHFAADVAHEIKNPLTSLRSAVETVARVKTPQDRDRLMEIILHDVQRLDRLISDISNASRLDAELSRDEMGRVDLRHLLESLATFQRPLLQGSENGAVALKLPAGEIVVRGNEGRLGQVFENLITNALSFSPNKAVVVAVTLEKRLVIVSVEDEGPGIPESKLETIFERFYTERPKHEDYGQHSGLGLSIAKQIVNAHGGEIFAENRYDASRRVIGARFVVVLEAA
jgi:two-component system sensor histidine kinase ChvG